MTREEIMELSDEGLRLRVAEARGRFVRIKSSRCGITQNGRAVWIPPYGRSISAAWELVEELVSMGWYAKLYNHPDTKGKEWYIDLFGVATIGGERGPAIEDVIGQTAPIAICRAYLIAKERVCMSVVSPGHDLYDGVTHNPAMCRKCKEIQNALSNNKNQAPQG